MEQGRGKARHVYLSREQEIILDAIGEAMGAPRTGVRPSRSALIAKAVQNFIDECRADPALASAIESTEARLRKDGPHTQARRQMAHGLLVVGRKAQQ